MLCLLLTPTVLSRVTGQMPGKNGQSSCAEAAEAAMATRNNEA